MGMLIDGQWSEADNPPAEWAKSGAFTLALRGPDAGSPYVLYRVSAKLGGKTYSTEGAVAR